MNHYKQFSQEPLPLSKITASTDKYDDWEIESLLGLLHDKAVEIGEAHSQAMFQRTSKYAPLAHRATTGYKVIEVVRQLQQELADVKKELANAKAHLELKMVEEKKTRTPRAKKQI